MKTGVEYMKGHPDNVSPTEYLRDRLKIIDHYVWRLEKSGNTGTDFMNFYIEKSKEYRKAIELLEANPQHENKKA